MQQSGVRCDRERAKLNGVSSATYRHAAFLRFMQPSLKIDERTHVSCTEKWYADRKAGTALDCVARQFPSIVRTLTYVRLR